MHQTAQDRQARILDLLREEQFLPIASLTERFQISVATARRDLAELETEGLLRRTHGGAVSLNQAGQDASHAARLVSFPAEKAAIGAAAAALIADGDAVLLDAGTTALEVAKCLKERTGLTVISNGIDIVNELTGINGNRVYSVGGEFTDTNRSFSGPLAEEFIRHFTVDKLILNTTAIDIARGLICTASPQNASLQRSMLAAARRTIIVADASKLMKSSLSVTARLDDLGTIVTDERALALIEGEPPELQKKFLIAPPLRSPAKED